MNFIVLDTETTNLVDEPIMYDLGYAVIDENGNVLKTESLVIKEVFFDDELMASAYFIEKVPQYIEAIANGTRKVVSLYEAKRMLRNDCVAYGVKYISAHNARFDYTSTTTTQRYMTSSKYRYFMPFGVRIIDTLKMARQVFGSDDSYRSFCVENDYLTNRGQNRYTAEILYRYLSGNNDFIEEHQGLDDVLIEKDILLHCLKNMELEDGLLW